MKNPFLSEAEKVKAFSDAYHSIVSVNLCIRKVSKYEKPMLAFCGSDKNRPELAAAIRDFKSKSIAISSVVEQWRTALAGLIQSRKEGLPGDPIWNSKFAARSLRLPVRRGVRRRVKRCVRRCVRRHIKTEEERNRWMQRITTAFDKEHAFYLQSMTRHFMSAAKSGKGDTSYPAIQAGRQIYNVLSESGNAGDNLTACILGMVRNERNCYAHFEHLMGEIDYAEKCFKILVLLGYAVQSRENGRIGGALGNFIGDEKILEMAKRERIAAPNISTRELAKRVKRRSEVVTIGLEAIRKQLSRFERDGMLDRAVMQPKIEAEVKRG